MADRESALWQLSRALEVLNIWVRYRKGALVFGQFNCFIIVVELFSSLRLPLTRLCFVDSIDKNALLSLLQQLFSSAVYTQLHSASPSPTTQQCFASLFTLLSSAVLLPTADLHLSLLSLLSHRQQQLLVALFQCTAYPELVLEWVSKVRTVKQVESMISKHVMG